VSVSGNGWRKDFEVGPDRRKDEVVGGKKMPKGRSGSGEI
jgi:hypothetical protein